MKKIFLFMLVLMAAVLILCSCSQPQMKYSVEKNGVMYEVDKENNTISDGNNIYKYKFVGNDSDYEVNITYPDGSTYWWKMRGYSGSGGWSDDYDREKYTDGDILTDVLLEDAPKAKYSGENFLAIILLIALGLFNIFAPHTAWYLEYGWRYKDAEPSDAAVVFNRLGGIVAIIIATILIFA